MQELQIFSSEKFGQVRTIIIDDVPYFVGKDVAGALGYAKERNALATHVGEDDKKVAPIQGPLGGTQEMVVINESGLYSLIFGSRLDSAKEFKHWVTSEVLPSLRKTGSYEMPKHLENPMELLELHYEAIKYVDKKVDDVGQRVDKLEYDIPLYGCESDELAAHVKRKGVAVLGGKQSEAYKDTGIRSKVYRDIYDQIKREFGIYDDAGHYRSYKALKRKYIYEAHELIDCYEPPVYLREVIDGTNAQMRMEVA